MFQRDSGQIHIEKDTFVSFIGTNNRRYVQFVGRRTFELLMDGFILGFSFVNWISTTSAFNSSQSEGTCAYVLILCICAQVVLLHDASVFPSRFHPIDRRSTPIILRFARYCRVLLDWYYCNQKIRHFVIFLLKTNKRKVKAQRETSASYNHVQLRLTPSKKKASNRENGKTSQHSQWWSNKKISQGVNNARRYWWKHQSWCALLVCCW